MAKANRVLIVTEMINNTLHDPSTSCAAFFGKMEARTGVARLRLLIGILLLISVSLLVFGANAMVLSNAIGLINPAYSTLSLMISPPEWKSYEPAAAAVKAQNKKFTYWLIFCALLTVEQVCGCVLFLFPWYMLLRTFFLVWCFAPIQSSGAALIYKKFIYKIIKPTRKPFVIKSKCSKSKDVPEQKPPIRRKCVPPRRSPQTTAWRSALRK